MFNKFMRLFTGFALALATFTGIIGATAISFCLFTGQEVVSLCVPPHGFRQEALLIILLVIWGMVFINLFMALLGGLLGE